MPTRPGLFHMPTRPGLLVIEIERKDGKVIMSQADFDHILNTIQGKPVKTNPTTPKKRGPKTKSQKTK